MGRRRIHAAFILYKTLGYPELGYILSITGPTSVHHAAYYCDGLLTLLYPL